ncbi:hypothetical protein [Actinophytocola sp.]|uniref:hypothetical protein n=1 Tax=Actinophytocola sp. TaxID=1872138 RepID=UPI002D7EF188|nr:hypothetical protein [Actinophytocola sp.]HET9144131.1 hypothetical protein [Actinophytocola sp.]
MRKITHEPRRADKALTLGELRSFIADAERNEIPDDALIEVRTSGFSTLRIREISADDRHTAASEKKATKR